MPILGPRGLVVSKEKLDQLILAVCNTKGLFHDLVSMRGRDKFYEVARGEIFNIIKALEGGTWSNDQRSYTSYILYNVFCRCFGVGAAENILIGGHNWIRVRAEVLKVTKECVEPINELEALNTTDVFTQEYGANFLNKGDKQMAANIETKVFIQGVDATQVTDSQIFSSIARIEQEIEALEKIQNKPETLKAKINSMWADVKALAEYVDTRAK